LKRGAAVIFFGLFILYLASACGDGHVRDSDNDGLSDADEIQVYHTDPLNADTDGDDRNDGDEVLAGTNPLVADYTRTLTLNNNASKDVTVYIVFIGGLTGNGGTYAFDYFKDQGCDNSYDPTARPDRCRMTIPTGRSKTLNLNKGGIDISGGLDNEPMGPCPTTMFEINISPKDNPTTDHFDLSLVNGFNYAMQIKSSKGKETKYVTTAKGNRDAFGVFPLGCSACVAAGSVPPAFRGSSCPGDASSCSKQGQCFDPSECKSGPDEFNADVRCEVPNVPTGGNYTVDFGDPAR
jgi:hypothetical protein